MKKILALVMAMALLVCSAAVFTVSAAEATFDELVAAEKEWCSVTSADFAANDSHHIGGIIQWSDNDDGSVHVALNAVNTARLGVHYNKELKIDGTHFVIDNVDCSTASATKLAFLIGASPSADFNAATLIEFSTDGNILNYNNYSSSTGSDVVAAIYSDGPTMFSFTEDNNLVTMTITNAAGTVSFDITGYGSSWTNRSVGYINIVTQSATGLHEFDIVAFHSGNEVCGLDAGKIYTNTVEYDSAIYGTSLDMWIGNEGGNPGDYWYAGGASNTLKPGEYTGSGFEKSVNTDGSVHLYVGAHSSVRFFYTANKSYAIDGAHMVLGQIKSSSGRFGLQITNGEGGTGTTWLVFKSNGELYNMYNGWGGEQPVGADAAVVGAMFAEDAKTVLSFAKLGTGFDLTIQNAAGAVTFYVQHGLNPAIDWTAGTSKVNFAICDWASVRHDTDMQVDVYAIHGGEDECGLSLQQKIEAGNEMNADLAAATSGATVKLTSNAAVDSVVVKPGVTLDLNGYTLEADYAASFGDVVNGTLKVAKDNVMLSADNAGLPVWNGEAYVFVAAPTFQHQYSVTGSNVTYTFLPTFDANVHALLDDGADASNVSVTVRLNWTAKEGGKATQSFVYSDAFVQEVIGSYDGAAYGKAFTLLFNNAANLADLTYAVEIVSGTGVVVAPTDAATEVVA